MIGGDDFWILLLWYCWSILVKNHRPEIMSLRSLKGWILQCAKNEISCERDILLIDGGVSTHLEQLLQDRGASFPHRSLWSSSLLLTPKGRDWIQKGHDDWLLAGSDILTTVTYQCHYGTLNNAPPVVANDNEYVEIHHQIVLY